MTSRAPAATTHPRGDLPRVALSAQLVELDGAAPRVVRLLPAGTFKARDGRPDGLPGWTLDDAGATALLNAALSRQDRYLIDYDHQTLYASQNGGKAPAAGWFSQLEWRPGDGLYATDVQWTAAATAAIQAREYRYISPVLTFDPATGAVTGLLMAALVNHPALDGLTDLALAHFTLGALASGRPEGLDGPAGRRRSAGHYPVVNHPLTAGAAAMIPDLITLLNLPDAAEPEAVLAAVIELKAQADGFAAKAQVNTPPDPARYAPIEALSALQTELAALTAKVREDELQTLIAPALADGRLLPAQREWAEALGRRDLASLSAYLETAQPLAALTGTQTQGQAPDPTGPVTAFKAAPGYAVAEDRAALHARVLAYQRQHACDYLTAATAIGA